MRENRVDKINYYLDVAETISKRGTCFRKNYGSVIVKNDEIISTGYTGAPRKRQNCIDLGYCVRRQLHPEAKRGSRYDLCRSVHSEMNAIISASRKDMMDSTLYLVGKYSDNKKYNKEKTSKYAENPDCCHFCKRLIINAGIEKVVIRIDKESYKVIDVNQWIDNDELLQGIEGY